ncbi:Lrp/AsnC family transcriptional regulator [Candidatus Woesearchaeota archaeon]|nr:Lrp/AsnC family transcriptional regulator [Candidatus Woesearchaeota archaeon]
MKKLDKTNKKILGILKHNSRTPYSKIAKELKINRTIIAYRIEQLIKKGVIRSFEPKIDYEKIGYFKYLCYIGFYDFDKKTKEKIIHFLKTHPFSAWLGECIGKYQIRLRVLAKDKSHFYRILSEIEQEFGSNLREIKTLHMVEPIKQDNEIVFRGGKKLIVKKPKPIELDDKDYLILQGLTKNCRETLLNLSKKTGLSIEGLRNRIKSLEKNGIILGYTCNINTHSIEDVGLWGNILVKFKNPERIAGKLREFTSQRKQLGRSFLLFGDWNAEFTFFTKDMQTLHDLLNEFLTEFSKDIHQYDIIFYLEGHKYPPVPEGVLVVN